MLRVLVCHELIMRVLFITSRFPGELRRGDQRRAYEQLRGLSSRHAITLLTLDHPQPSEPRQSLDFCEQVIRIPYHTAGMLMRIARSLPGSVPLQCALYDAPALRHEMLRQIARNRFDLLPVQLARLGPMLAPSPKLPCVLDLVDALPLNLPRRAQYDHGPARRLARMEAKRLAVYERELCTRVDAAAISAPSRSRGPRQPAQSASVGNGSISMSLRSRRIRVRREIAFVGNLGYFRMSMRQDLVCDAGHAAPADVVRKQHCV